MEKRFKIIEHEKDSEYLTIADTVLGWDKPICNVCADTPEKAQTTAQSITDFLNGEQHDSIKRALREVLAEMGQRPDDDRISTCESCGKPIYDGQEYFVDDGNIYFHDTKECGDWRYEEDQKT